MSDDLLTTEKTANYSARAGQVIAGNLARGGDGKFTAAGNATAKAPAYRKARGSSRSILVKRQAAKRGKKAGAAKKPAAPKGKAPKSPAAQEREQLALQSARERIADARKRRAERDADRAQRQQDRAKREIEKAGQQAQRASQAAQRDRDKAQRTAERKAEIERRRTEQQAKRQEGKGGGGGGKAKPEDRDAKKAAEQAKNRATVQAATLDPAAFDAFTALAEGGDADPAQVDVLVKTGLIERDTQGGTRVSAAGRSYLVAANSGDVGRAKDAMSRAADRAKRAAKTATKEARPLSVFKQANGQYRWVLWSSSAFRDRDEEITTLKALEADCARADADGKYGPLRLWHIGTPNALDRDRPWGPGLDIGDCDYNAVVGRSLIESGTFHDPAMAMAIKATADQWGASQGFFHPLTEPDADGLYHTIRRFERSLLPIGRESNRLTSLYVQEAPAMANEAKLKELEEKLGPDILASLLERQAQKEADAEAAGVTFKAEGEPMPEDAPAEEPAEPDGDEGLFTPAEMQQFAAMLAPLLMEAMGGMTTKATSEIAAVRDEVVAVKAKTADLDATIVAAVKSATTLQEKQAELAAAEARLNARLKALEGDQPAAFRASTAAETTITAEQATEKQFTTPGKTVLDQQVDFVLGPAA